MIKFLSKPTFLTLLVCCLTLFAKAQIGYNYAKVDLGIGFTSNQVFGDVAKKTTTQSFGGSLTYHISPFFNIVSETQFGSLAGGNQYSDPNGRQFKGNFFSTQLREQLQVGELIDYSDNNFYNAIKNFYSSVGVGVLVNHVTSITRPIGSELGTNNTNIVFIPFKVGYEFKIFNDYDQPYIKIDLGVQLNAMLSDNLDGYAYGATNDFLIQETLGIKFAIGAGNTSYRKQVSY